MVFSFKSKIQLWKEEIISTETFTNFHIFKFPNYI